MGLANLILRIFVAVLCAAAFIVPFAWTECVLAIGSLSSVGLSLVCITVAIGIIVVDTGDELHCEIIEGIMGCILILGGIVHVSYDSDCNLYAVLILMVIAGVLFLVDMILLILGKGN